MIADCSRVGTVGRLREERPGYRVRQDQASDRLILVLVADSRAGDGIPASTLASEFAEIEFEEIVSGVVDIENSQGSTRSRRAPHRDEPGLFRPQAAWEFRARF